MTETTPLPMGGMKREMLTRILECARGGYIVIVNDHGVTARSTWPEVMDALEEFGVDVMKVERFQMPKIVKPPVSRSHFDDTEPITIKGAIGALGSAIVAVLTAMLAFISVKIA